MKSTLIVVTDSVTSKKVTLTPEMIENYYVNDNGKTVVETKHEGSHTIEETIDYLNNILKP